MEVRVKQTTRQVEERCTVSPLLHLLAGKWVLPVLYHLHRTDRPMRFGEIRRAVGSVTQKECTKVLRLLERLQLVTRTVYAEVPVRVEYALTPLGLSLKQPL